MLNREDTGRLTRHIQRIWEQMNVIANAQPTDQARHQLYDLANNLSVGVQKIIHKREE